MRTRRVLLLFCFFSVLLVANLSVVVKAEQSNFWIDLTVSPSPYVLRNDVITINATGNFSTATVEFWHEGAYLAGYSHTANTTRQFTVSDAYPYGEYEIKAKAGDSVTTTFLSVVNVGGWLPTTFPYQRNHKGVDYTFFANGSIKADNGNDVMFVDLSTLRTLVNLYNLEVEAYYNSMNFRVNFRKAGIANINFVFTFIHTGCKFVVEGELDQARDFEFNVAHPEKLRSLVDGVKQGSLVFDYSDLRRASHAFSYSDGVLTLSLPQTFSFDPTLFEDGFEDGTFDAFGATSGTPTVTTDYAHHGVYSAYFTGTGPDWIRADIGTQTTVYTSCMLRLNSAMDNYASWYVRRINYGATEIAIVWLYHTTGTQFYLKIYRYYPAGATLQSGAISLTVGEWYRIEFAFIRDAVVGAYYAWFDNAAEGSPDISDTGLDTSDITGCNYVYFGNTLTGAVDYHIDCVVVSDAYIGPEAAGPEPNIMSEEYLETIVVSDSLAYSKTLYFTGQTTIETTSLNYYSKTIYFIGENTFTVSEVDYRSKAISVTSSETVTGSTDTAYVKQLFILKTLENILSATIEITKNISITTAELSQFDILIPTATRFCTLFGELAEELSIADVALAVAFMASSIAIIAFVYSSHQKQETE